MRVLAPMHVRRHYYDHIEELIRRALDDIFYRPLMQIIGMSEKQVKSELKNSKSAILDAITRGLIWYGDGAFHGEFNARTSSAIIKLGGVFNVPSRTYSLPERKLPTEIKFAQAAANSRYEDMRAKMLSVIDSIEPERIEILPQIKDGYEKTLGDMETDIQKTFAPYHADQQEIDNPVFSRLAIEAKLTDEQKEVISENWAKNLDLYIKNWTADNIIKLREQIQPRVMAGGRAEHLEKMIRDNYGVGARKAKFLARQETALLMSEFQQTRYQASGIEKYIWSDSHDQRVRHDHHLLNGKTFSWNNPPVTNKKTGARNHPGKDFNCRCIAIPVVD